MGGFEKMISANGMLWTLCRLRKTTTCAATGKPMNVGDEAYRPITNGSDRMKRIKPMSIHSAKASSPTPTHKDHSHDQQD